MFVAFLVNSDPACSEGKFLYYRFQTDFETAITNNTPDDNLGSAAVFRTSRNARVTIAQIADNESRIRATWDGNPRIYQILSLDQAVVWDTAARLRYLARYYGIGGVAFREDQAQALYQTIIDTGVRFPTCATDLIDTIQHSEGESEPGQIANAALMEMLDDINEYSNDPINNPRALPAVLFPSVWQTAITKVRDAVREHARASRPVDTFSQSASVADVVASAIRRR